MTFDELKFKAEDFGSIKMHMSNNKIKTDIVRLDETIQLANSILREKLDRAPGVFGIKPMNGEMLWSGALRLATHKARLVCIEEVGK